MKPLSDGHEFAVFNEEVREWIHSNRESGGSIRKLLVGSKHLQTLSTSEIPHILGSSGHLNLLIGVKRLFVPRSLQMSSSITTLCFCQKLSGGWYRAPVTGVDAPSSDLIVLPIINMGEMFFTNIFIRQFSFVYCEPKCFTPQLSHLLNKTRVFFSWPMTTLIECSGDHFSPWSTCLNTSCWDQSGRVATSVFETFSSKELRSIRDTVFLVNFTLVFQLNRFQTQASSSWICYNIWHMFHMFQKLRELKVFHFLQ